MVEHKVNRYGVVTSSLIAALLAVSLIVTPSAAAVILFTDPDDVADDNLDIKEVGIEKNEPYIMVYGVAGGTRSTTSGQAVFYQLVTNIGAYIFVSHLGVEDSSEVKNDQKFHVHKVILSSGSDPDCPDGSGGFGSDVVTTEEGKAKITKTKLILTGTSATDATAIRDANTFTADLRVISGHTCLFNLSQIDFAAP